MPGLLAVENALDFGFKTKQLGLLNSVYRKASKDKVGRSGLLVAREAMMLETRAAWNNTLHEAACPAGLKGLDVGSKC